MITLTIADVDKLQTAINDAGISVDKAIQIIYPHNCANCYFKYTNHNNPCLNCNEHYHNWRK